MSELLYDAVARIARHEVSAQPVATMAVVIEVHTTVVGRADHAVSVRLRDTGVVVPRVPVAVGALGLAVTPAVGDLVLVVFADGDVHGGVVVGRLHHRDLHPPEHGPGQVVLALPPGQDEPSVELRADPATPEVRLLVGEVSITVAETTVTVAVGDAEVLVDGGSPATVRVTAGDSTLVLSGGGDASLEATGTLSLKASRVEITGDASVRVSGGTVEVN